MYYHINDIIFLVRFPQFVGSLRRDVWTTAYWRGRPTRSLHVTPIGSDSCAIVPRLSPFVLRHYSFPRGFRTALASLKAPNHTIINEPRAISTRRRVNESTFRAAKLRPVVVVGGGGGGSIGVSFRGADEIEISFRLDGDTQLCIKPGYGVRMHRKLARPSGPARGYISIIRGNYYERPSSSILIFCSRPLRPPPRGKD